MEYVKKGSTAVVRTDDGEKMVRNNANLYEILVSENIKEQLQFYNKRDVSRLSFLERRKFKLNKANFGTAISTVAATGALTVLDGVNAIDTEFSRGLQVGAFVLGTSIIFINESVLTRRRELLGLRKCVKYELEKIAALENKIESLKYDSVDECGDEVIRVDSRLKIRQLNDVLNFIFYYASNKSKVKRIYEKHELYKLLREMNIISIESIAEIELYLYNEFENEKTYMDGIIKK